MRDTRLTRLGIFHCLRQFSLPFSKVKFFSLKIMLIYLDYGPIIYEYYVFYISLNLCDNLTRDKSRWETSEVDLPRLASLMKGPARKNYGLNVSKSILISSYIR